MNSTFNIVDDGPNKAAPSMNQEILEAMRPEKGLAMLTMLMEAYDLAYFGFGPDSNVATFDYDFPQPTQERRNDCLHVKDLLRPGDVYFESPSKSGNTHGWLVSGAAEEDLIRYFPMKVGFQLSCGSDPAREGYNLLRYHLGHRITSVLLVPRVGYAEKVFQDLSSAGATDFFYAPTVRDLEALLPELGVCSMNTKKEWFAYVLKHADKLESLIEEFHPASPNYTESMVITARGAEDACATIRKRIAKEDAGELLSPVQRFRQAVEDRAHSKIGSLLFSAWFGVPESTKCWRILGFREAVKLLENPYESLED